MENAKEKSSLSGSKSELNESSFPLLEGEEVDLKDSESKGGMEMKSKGEEGKEEENKDSKQSSNDDKASKKKQKQKKEKASAGPSLTDRLTTGINLLDRDILNVNDHVNIIFEDVLAEPSANHGFDATWSLSFLIFSGTKLWIYRIISALLAIPCGLMWGIIFSLMTLLNVWLVSPLLCFFKVVLDILHKLWSSVISTFFDPIFKSAGQLFSSINVKTTHTQAETMKNS